MNFEARIESLDGKLPKVSYHWDPETDILSVACKGGATSDGLNGTVDLEGADGSFVVIDVAGGSLRGVDVVSWPDDVRTVADLATPAVAKEGRVVFPSRLSRPGGLSEPDKYERLVERVPGLWWSDAGPFVGLHQLNVVRVDYFRAVFGGFGGKRVLDVGCGGGILAEALAAQGAE